ncbi:MAG: glycosyltransferase family 2 protein [Spirosomataceae bacterium]
MSHLSPTVSVLMAVYNTPVPLVQRAVSSVLRQDFKHFELLILDDGSHPALSAQIQSVCLAMDDRVRYFRHENQGQSLSINRGVELSKGAYVSIIDSDDEYKPNHLTTCLSAMKNADLVATSTETIVTSNEDFFVPDRYDTSQNIHVDDCILFATLFGKKEVFASIPFKQMYAADSHFFDEVVAAHFRTKKLNSRTYVYYRNIPTSTTAQLKKQQITL